MTNTTQGAIAPKTTANHAFETAGSAGELLFTVNDGIPLVDALESAACYLSAAVSATASAAMHAEGGGDETLWGAHYLCKLARAVLDSTVKAAYAAERGEQS